MSGFPWELSLVVLYKRSLPTRKIGFSQLIPIFPKRSPALSLYNKFKLSGSGGRTSKFHH